MFADIILALVSAGAGFVGGMIVASRSNSQLEAALNKAIDEVYEYMSQLSATERKLKLARAERDAAIERVAQRNRKGLTTFA